MTAQRAVLALGAAAIIATAAAWFVTTAGDEESNITGKVLPSLSADLDSVTVIEIEKAGTGYQLSLQEGQWVVDQFDGFPADQQKLRSVLNGLARMDYIERKTANPARHDRLELQDPALETSASTGITLRDNGGKTLASVIFGKTTRSAEGTRPARQYLRQQDDNQSWLVSMTSPLPDEAKGWLNLEILKMPRDDVRLARLSYADGETVEVQRQTKDQADFVLQQVPAGFQPKSDFIANSLGSAMGWPSLQAPARLPDSFEILGDGYFESFDGLVLTIQVIQGGDGQKGMTLAATGTDKTAKDKAAAINALANSWMFSLPDHKINELTRRLDYYIEPLQAVEEAQ